MTEKLRVYLTFDESFSCDLDKSSKCGRPTLKHKVILSTKEDQASNCLLLITKFCEKYNSSSSSSPLDPSRLQLQLGATTIKPNFQPITNYISDYNEVNVVFLPPVETEAQHEPGSVPCTNFGCGKRFVPGRDDKEPLCAHHSGKPVFHDTYKYWTCCKEKKTMEFDEFEKIPACAMGFHRHDPVSIAVAVGGGGGAGANSTATTASSTTTTHKPLTEEEIRALDSQNNKNVHQNRQSSNNDDNTTGPITRGPREFNQGKSQEPGKPVDAEGNYKCRRFGCGKKFHPNDNNDTACQYHTQGPVFHDTYKFWACCKEKKCSDFDEFEKVPKCATGPHLM
jgi:hypothetical protein